MKRLLLPFLFLVPLASYAQTSNSTEPPSLLDKGILNVGLNIGSGGQANDSQTSLHFSPRLQYFVANRWAFALDGRYEQKKSSRDRFIGAGLSTRVYFLNARRLAIFGQAGAVVGQSRDYYTNDWGWCGVGRPNDYQPERNHSNSVDLQAAASTGVRYSLCKRLSLEASVERVLFDSRSGDSRGCSYTITGAWRAGVGVNYRLR